jgi:transposase InsO family protein
VDAKALSSITAKCIEKFLWKNIICRHAFVTDNGRQFDCDSFREWCAKLSIRNYFSSPGHPQAIDLVEATNKTIFKILKKKLGDRKRDWAEDLPEVLWAY